MTEAQKVETKPEPKHEAEAQTADGTPDDKLATTRLPPLAPPPLAPPPRPHRTGSTPPPPVVQAVQPAPQPQPAPVHVAHPYPSVIVDGGARPAMASRVQPRTSWWKGFLESSFPPPAVPAPAGERTTRRRIGSACAVLSLAVVVCALAIGLHGAPPLSPRPPVIDAAIVIARAIMGLGMLGVGLSLLRIGEHLLLSRGPADERPRDSH